MRTNTNIQRCTEIIVWGIPVEEAETLAVVVLEILVETILCLVVLAILEGREKILEDLDMEKATMITVRRDAITLKRILLNIKKRCVIKSVKSLMTWKPLPLIW